MVVEIPVCIGEKVRSIKDVSIWEQISLAAFMQEHWADNQVSCTVTFDPKTEDEAMIKALEYFQYKLKGISFMPKLQQGIYPQMPYEEITKQKYEELLKGIKAMKSMSSIDKNDPEPENFCDGDKCLSNFGMNN